MREQETCTADVACEREWVTPDATNLSTSSALESKIEPRGRQKYCVDRGTTPCADVHCVSDRGQYVLTFITTVHFEENESTSSSTFMMLIYECVSNKCKACDG